MFYFPALILDLRALVCELTRERYIYISFPRAISILEKNSYPYGNIPPTLIMLAEHYPGSIGRIFLFLSLDLDLKSTSWDRERGDGRKYPARLLIFENTESVLEEHNASSR